ncbi:MAG: PepSY domain-containing protein [Anderseniella sp.]|jgi:hypothetical protein|nr:PepSY domain-containing protein [Anderseniella sp.]
MKTTAILALASLALMSGTALASSSDCNEPRDKWMSMDQARAKVTAMGYDVRKLEVDDGCYEAYATKDGKRLEIYLNPVTAEIVKMKEDD